MNSNLCAVDDFSISKQTIWFGVKRTPKKALPSSTNNHLKNVISHPNVCDVWSIASWEQIKVGEMLALGTYGRTTSWVVHMHKLLGLHNTSYMKCDALKLGPVSPLNSSVIS